MVPFESDCPHVLPSLEMEENSSLSLTTVVNGSDPFSDITAAFMNTSGPGDCDSDVLVYPEPVIRKKTNRKSVEKFFILTTKEAYDAKVKQKEEKEKRENEKKIKAEKPRQAEKPCETDRPKQVKRQTKCQAEKDTKENNEQLERQKKSGRPNKKREIRKGQLSKSVTVSVPSVTNDDTTPCMYCEISYSESTVGWIRCKTCGLWACTTCAHVTKRQKVYVCDACK